MLSDKKSSAAGEAGVSSVSLLSAGALLLLLSDVWESLHCLCRIFFFFLDSDSWILKFKTWTNLNLKLWNICQKADMNMQLYQNPEPWWAHSSLFLIVYLLWFFFVKVEPVGSLFSPHLCRDQINFQRWRRIYISLPYFFVLHEPFKFLKVKLKMQLNQATDAWGRGARWSDPLRLLLPPQLYIIFLKVLYNFMTLFQGTSYI